MDDRKRTDKNENGTISNNVFVESAIINIFI